MAIQLGQYLRETTAELQDAGIDSARLDVLILLEDALGRDRSWLLAHPEVELSDTQTTELRTKIDRRAKHVPLAYIRGKTLFYGREFVLNEHVLVPRPETETMLTLLKDLPLSAAPRIEDIGTGSGCIGITAALEIPGAVVTLCDIDSQALAIARQNAVRLNANVSFQQTDLLQDTPACDVVLANLPYVPQDYPINDAARHEPKLALFAGNDGLDLYRRFFQDIHVVHPVFVLTESLKSQHGPLAALAKKAGYRLLYASDLIQLFTRA